MAHLPPGGEYFDGGDDFGFELGAELRLRVFDDPPAQAQQDYGGVLRRADWDETSDFGQIIRLLRLGQPGGQVSLRAGPMAGLTLGHGHLISRYGNRENPDYHPCGAFGHFVVGPVRTELVASDVLGARLFAAELSADLGRILSEDSAVFDRYHLALSLAHDQGAAGQRAPSLTLMQLDLDLALLKEERARIFTFLGVGTRFSSSAADLGAVLGLSADGAPGGVEVGGKLELRKQSGGFRPGMFGPSYELQRFAGTGLSGEPLANELVPDGFSGYGELALSSGPVSAGDSQASRGVFSIAVEYFNWGRTDADLSLAVHALEGKGTVTLHAGALAVGQDPRYSLTGEGRYRFAPAFYALVSGGTVFFPQPDSTLVPGVFAGLGLGADFHR